MSGEDFFAAAEGPKRRRSMSALAQRNRELLAERGGWPDGAVNACVQLEIAFPGFTVFWFPEWKTPAGSFDTEAGFYAWVTGHEPLHHGRKRKEWYGATAEELRAELANSWRAAGSS